ncbi:hypothetical protein GCM10009839_49400 [Catenulispora yoronensis]|uniref:Uncharacterized protein n=1 Tax=Catenulispora yoronensis TaxID=450799 RepID=A0ABP5GB35_9ACTN
MDQRLQDAVLGLGEVEFGEQARHVPSEFTVAHREQPRQVARGGPVTDRAMAAAGERSARGRDQFLVVVVLVLGGVCRCVF